MCLARSFLSTSITILRYQPADEIGWQLVERTEDISKVISSLARSWRLFLTTLYIAVSGRLTEAATAQQSNRQHLHAPLLRIFLPRK